jgi:outer membrane protein OmpA-like peptidoglycan-associated protein
MLLVGAAIAGCASQTDRSSSGGGAQAQAEPERESVQYVDHPLEESPPPKPAAVAVAPKATAPKDETTPDFPITKYELPEEEEVEDLGPQEDESASAEQEAAVAEDSSVGETTEYADEQEADSGEVEDLGPQEDESASAEQEAAPAEESSVGETTEYADEQEADAGEVEDLGPQTDDSGTVSFPEEKRASADNVVGEPTIYADEPAPKAATAAPQKSTSATPKSVTVNFETEPLFSFDKSAVRADQRAKLDELIAGLSGTQYESITVVGHADRIGKDTYNQKLSERRAAAVKKYLVKMGVPDYKIQTEGRGESQPVTGDACKSVRGKALISCLQPDRRVDVSVSAMKQSN